MRGMSLKVQEIMIKDVITLGVKASVNEAVKIMDEYQIGCLVVVENGNAIGIVTERDMLKRVLLEAKDPEATKISQIMTAPLVVGNPQMTVQEAVELMTHKKIKKLPIAENGNIVGMVTLTDLVRSVAYLEHVFSKVYDNMPT